MFCKNKCSLCKHIIFISEVADAGDSIQLNLPDMTIGNNDKLCFIITETLPQTNTPVPVILIANGDKVPYISKSGNYVYSDQIQARTLYIARAKTDTGIFLNVKCNLKSTSKVMPHIPNTKILVDKSTKGSDKK